MLSCCCSRARARCRCCRRSCRRSTRSSFARRCRPHCPRPPGWQPCPTTLAARLTRPCLSRNAATRHSALSGCSLFGTAARCGIRPLTWRRSATRRASAARSHPLASARVRCLPFASVRVRSAPFRSVRSCSRPHMRSEREGGGLSGIACELWALRASAREPRIIASEPHVPAMHGAGCCLVRIATATSESILVAGRSCCQRSTRIQSPQIRARVRSHPMRVDDHM